MRTTLDKISWLARRGPRYALSRVAAKITAPTARCWPAVRDAIEGKSGIEVGGPSSLFKRRGQLPLYPIVGSLDCCNFSHETIWEGALTEGATFHYGDRVGRQYIAEAWQLPVPAASYDFVASCHMLEHSANPIRVLREWHRVIKPGGHLLLVLPDGARTFDRRRPITSLAHLIEDFGRGVGEDDLTHMAEAIELHDLSKTQDEMRFWLRDNPVKRGLHHHVFDEALGMALVKECGFSVIASELTEPNNIIIWAALTEPQA